jgi:hypothetical protein
VISSKLSDHSCEFYLGSTLIEPNDQEVSENKRQQNSNPSPLALAICWEGLLRAGCGCVIQESDRATETET